MSRQWLASENFERNHDVVASINTLVIHCQLSLSGTSDPTSPGEIARAQSRLRQFFNSFCEFVRELEKDEEAPLLGADPRLTSLAHGFILARKTGNPRVLRELRLEQVHQWLQRPNFSSLSRAERAQLIEFLRSLRSLLENNTHADVVGLLGVL